MVWPGARSLAWLDERASGRLWRSRFIRLKPMGISGSDMVSKFSADAKDTLLAWSARAGCVGLSRVTRGVRVCKTQDKKLGEKKKKKRGRVHRERKKEDRWWCWDIYLCRDGHTVINGVTPKNVEHTNKSETKWPREISAKTQNSEWKRKLLAHRHRQNKPFTSDKAAFTSSSTNRDSTKRKHNPEDKIRAAQPSRLNQLEPPESKYGIV